MVQSVRTIMMMMMLMTCELTLLFVYPFNTYSSFHSNYASYVINLIFFIYTKQAIFALVFALVSLTNTCHLKLLNNLLIYVSLKFCGLVRIEFLFMFECFRLFDQAKYFLMFYVVMILCLNFFVYLVTLNCVLLSCCCKWTIIFIYLILVLVLYFWRND